MVQLCFTKEWMNQFRAENNESETRRFFFELVIDLHVLYIEYNCNTSQGEYLYNEKSLPFSYSKLRNKTDMTSWTTVMQ